MLKKKIVLEAKSQIRLLGIFLSVYEDLWRFSNLTRVQHSRAILIMQYNTMSMPNVIGPLLICCSHPHVMIILITSGLHRPTSCCSTTSHCIRPLDVRITAFWAAPVELLNCLVQYPLPRANKRSYPRHNVKMCN